MWGFCHGYPGRPHTEECIRYLAESQVETSLYYAAYPDVTVHEVLRALDARDELISFARAHQGRQDPRKLKNDYLKEARRWFP